MSGHLPFSMAPPWTAYQFLLRAHCSSFCCHHGLELPVPSREISEGPSITLLPELVR